MMNPKRHFTILLRGGVEAYNPNIKVKSEEKDLKVAFIEGGITPEGIKNNQTISILAYTGNVYCTYYLKCTTLPLMNIECPEEIPDESVPMKITLYDNRIDAAGRLLCAEGEIHVRGATASAYPKKGFRFSLKTESPGDNVRPNHLSLLGMRQDDDWLLYAAYNDQEKVRNVFSSNLWEDTCASDNALGIDFGMEYRYLELFINGKYWGLYALGYPIDEKQVCIDSDSQDAILYKHGLGSERLRFTKDGGIFDESPEQWEQTALQHYYYEIYRNADNNDRLMDGIDLDNAIDFYLFLNLVQGEDNTGLIKNYYILLQKENGAAKGLYAPWDLDLTWGNHYIGVLSENFTYPYGIREDFNCIVESGILYQLMINGDAAVWERVFEKYHAFRENEWSDEAINALIDKYEADIFESGAYLRDMERWPEGTYGNASDELSVFRAYVMNRLREADLYYERLEKAYEETSNVFIRRSAQYKNLWESRFIIEINEHSLLSQSEYAEFLEYLGVEVSSVTEEVRFILVNPGEKKVEYLSSLEEGEDARETCIGRLSFSKLREGVYDVKVDGVERFKTSIFSRPEIRMAVIEDIVTFDFNFTNGYDLWEQNGSFDEFAFYINALSGTDYRAVVEINRPDIWKDDRYRVLFGKLGIIGKDIRENTDFIVWCGPEKAAFVLEDFHIPGSSCETPLGSLGVYENEYGEYGVYLDGMECFVSSPEQNRNVDIRVVLLDPDSYERVDTITFSDELR